MNSCSGPRHSAYSSFGSSLMFFDLFVDVQPAFKRFLKAQHLSFNTRGQGVCMRMLRGLLQSKRLLSDGMLAVLILLLTGPSMSASSQAESVVEARDLFHPFRIHDPDSPYHGLLRRSAHAGLDWYFTSLAIALAPLEALQTLEPHFSAALRLLPVAGPMPIRPQRGLRRISGSGQVWELIDATEFPYAWNCAHVEFPNTAPLHGLKTDACGRTWRNGGRVAADAHWSLLDTTDDLHGFRMPDSHDGVTAVFLVALARWAKSHAPSGWLNVGVWRVASDSAPTGSTVWLTRADLIKYVVRHTLLNHMEGGLFRTFRHNRHPMGGQWDIQYLMDNQECLAALRALIPLFDAAGHSAFAQALEQYESTLARELAQLVSGHAHAPTDYKRWARQGDWPSDAAEVQFYPHVAGQYWPGLFDETAEAGLVNRWLNLEPHLGVFSDWWRQSYLHLGAGLPPYWARLRHVSGMRADVSPRLLQHASALTPANSVISDYVLAWQLRRLLTSP